MTGAKAGVLGRRRFQGTSSRARPLYSSRMHACIRKVFARSAPGVLACRRHHRCIPERSSGVAKVDLECLARPFEQLIADRDPEGRRDGGLGRRSRRLRRLQLADLAGQAGFAGKRRSRATPAHPEPTLLVTTPRAESQTDGSGRAPRFAARTALCLNQALASRPLASRAPARSAAPGGVARPCRDAPAGRRRSRRRACPGTQADRSAPTAKRRRGGSGGTRSRRSMAGGRSGPPAVRRRRCCAGRSRAGPGSTPPGRAGDCGR